MVDVSAELLADVLNIIVTVSYQIAEETYSMVEIEQQTPGRRADLVKLLDVMRTQRDSFIAEAEGADDVGLAFWREVDHGTIPLTGAARAAYAWFSRTIRAVMTIAPSEAAAERAFSCAKFVLDGRESLRDSYLERAVLLRSYLLSRCNSTQDWTKLVKKFAQLVHERRRQRAQAALAVK